MRDVSGNIDSATANVNVVDSVLPTVTVHDTVLYLDAWPDHLRHYGDQPGYV
ncbi:MAG: hypothetical protein R2813_10385 [Flavobacteriales bacterium]